MIKKPPGDGGLLFILFSYPFMSIGELYESTPWPVVVHYFALVLFYQGIGRTIEGARVSRAAWPISSLGRADVRRIDSAHIA